jgi:hypothetical protein
MKLKAYMVVPIITVITLVIVIIIIIIMVNARTYTFFPCLFYINI